jgi:hypothetical protein
MTDPSELFAELSAPLPADVSSAARSGERVPILIALGLASRFSSLRFMGSGTH